MTLKPLKYLLCAVDLLFLRLLPWQRTSKVSAYLIFRIIPSRFTSPVTRTGLLRRIETV